MKKQSFEDIHNSDKSSSKSKILKITERLAAYKNIPKFLEVVWITSPWLTLINIVLRLTQAVLPLVLFNIGKMIIDEIIAVKSHVTLSHNHLWQLVVMEFSLFMIMTILSRCITLIDDLIGELLTNRTNVLLMSHAATLDLSQFEDSVFYDKLDLARKQTADRNQIMSQILSQGQDSITIVLFIITLIAFNPWIILLLIVSMTPVIIGASYFNAKNYELIKSQTDGRRVLDYLNLIGSSDTTAKEIRLFDLSEFFIQRYKKISVNFYKAKRKLGINQTVTAVLLIIPGAIGFYLSFIFIINQVLSGAITLGDLTFLLGIIRQLIGLVQSSGRRFNSVSQGAIYLQDFFDFFEIQPTIKKAVNSRPFPNPIKMGITFENVGFKYNNSNHWATRHLNFTLQPGEKLALVGENGAGKTTIVKLLVRLYDPTEGRVLIDGYDLREYDLKELRTQMGVIFQDFIRYQFTASDNIAIGDIEKIDDYDKILQAAIQSFAHPIIDKLPNKYQQTLGHHFAGGFELSGGEWQKVALARAYMRKAPIIVLDEPTAALDARSEYEMFQRFAEVTENKTALFISHRFSTVRMADRIIVLDKGEIIEMGSHEELLMQEGRYAELFNLQAIGYK